MLFNVIRCYFADIKIENSAHLCNMDIQIHKLYKRIKVQEVAKYLSVSYFVVCSKQSVFAITFFFLPRPP